MKPFAVGLFLMCLVACESPSAAVAPPPEETTDGTIIVSFGDSITLPGEQFPIRFAAIDESRCPTGVVCVWEGDAAVSLDFSRTTYTLHTALAPRSRTIGLYVVELINVKPYPEFQKEIPPESYSITLKVRKED